MRNGLSLGQVIQNPVLVILPTISEHGNGQIIHTVIGPEHEIRLAGNCNPLAVVQHHLQLQPPATLPGMHPIAMLAIEHRILKLELTAWPWTPQRLQEALLQ